VSVDDVPFLSFFGLSDDDDDDDAERKTSNAVVSLCPHDFGFHLSTVVFFLSSTVVVTKATTTETASNVDGVERQRVIYV